tara:strand:+ start:394 stop:1356 length:963 start_codon:yes stop_codon:yes gene_type:complete
MGLKKIKEQNKEYDVSILDLLRLLDPSKTGKFMSILLAELKNIPSYEYGDYTENLNLNVESLPGINKVILNYLIDLVGGSDVIDSLKKFNDFLERKLITKNDIQQYLNLSEIIDVTYKKELELNNFTSTPHIDVISDDEYLILKPLNIISSRKYGASTKWCTASNNPETFYSYSKKGILIYIISRTLKDKWAVYYEFSNKELSWWNDVDERIDGLLVDLPENIKKDVLTFIFNEKHPNSHYFSEETNKLANKPTNEMAIIPDGRIVNTPEPFNGMWVNNQTPSPSWASNTTDERIDELVNKTLEFHYTINALKKGGEEIN